MQDVTREWQEAKEARALGAPGPPASPGPGR